MRPEDGLVLPEGASRLTRLRVAIRALRVLDERPDDGVAAPLFNASVDADVFQRLCDELSRTLDGRGLLDERPSLEARHLDVSALAALPSGTLGHALAHYFEDNHLRPFASDWAVHGDAEFLVRWYRETHDLHHVLTGYGTDAVGEMELQAFMAGNLGLRTSAVILGFAAVLRPHGLPPIWRYSHRLRAAFERGRAARRLITARYDRLLDAPLEAVRAQLHIPPAVTA